MTLQDIFNKVNSGEISDSQAYKMYLNATGDTNTNFKTFMQNAVDNGWLQKVGSTVGGFLQNKYGSQSQDPALITCPDGYENDGMGNCLPIKQGLSTGAWIGIGVGVAGLIGAVIYFKNKK